MLFFKQFSESMAFLDAGKAPINDFQRFHFATLDWKLPFAVAAAYAIIVTIWGRFNKKMAAASNGKTASSHSSPLFKAFVIGHNVLLTVFSAYCFVCISGLLIKSYTTRSFFDAYCDPDLKDFYRGINYLVWLFYVSKYYELLDTVILLLKGKPSSFLQTIHHSGSIISLWTMTVTRIPGLWIFTFLNSFIHTIMYIYYTLTCLGHQPSWKKLLTSMQITQFFIGNVLGILYFFIPGCFPDSRNFRENVIHKILGTHFRSVMFTFAYNFVFVGSLILLFNDFARRTYGKKKAAAAAAIEESSVKSKPSKAKKAKESKAKKVEAKEAEVIEAPKAKASKAKATKPTKTEKTPKAAAKAESVKATTRVTRKSAGDSEASLPEIVISQPATPPPKKRATSPSKSRGPVRRRSARK